MLLPFQRDRFLSNMFLVPQVIKARACLFRARFQSHPQSDAVLLDSETNRPIRIVEMERGERETT
jgi:hypothetical protein